MSMHPLASNCSGPARPAALVTLGPHAHACASNWSGPAASMTFGPHVHASTCQQLFRSGTSGSLGDLGATRTCKRLDRSCSLDVLWAICTSAHQQLDMSGRLNGHARSTEHAVISARNCCWCRVIGACRLGNINAAGPGIHVQAGRGWRTCSWTVGAWFRGAS